MFEKVDAKKRSIHVLEQVLKAIQEGRYKVGDRLPPELEISRQTGVSRASVREALGSLQLVGVIESRVGDGTYVRKQVGTTEELMLLSVLSENESPSEVLEARSAIEFGVVRLAIAKASAEDVSRMAQALEQMQAAFEREDRDSFVAADKAFHEAVLQATKNSVLVQRAQPLLDVMNQRLWRQVLAEDRAEMARSLEVHRDILEAIERKDAASGMQAMQQHYDEAAALLLKRG